ncbi:MAG: DNA repair protein RadC [Dehalococcoidia bacterium]|nr:DNA repair protein RadC [Dehalococcoidia bacterium]MDD5494813.1 DNA repair protein RadC [Dehalococcoidia bacterium]
MQKSFTIRDLPSSERPRERLTKHGAEALSTTEVLALILGRGTKGESVMLTAQKLLNHFGNVQNIAAASLRELCEIKGIGVAKAAQIKAAFELGRRAEDPDYQTGGDKISSPQEAVKSVQKELKGKKKEYFYIICLDTRNRVIGKGPVSIGNLDSSIVHPREVFKYAISSLAASVIFIHNHPSGDLEPSVEDISLTKRLFEAGELLGIPVLDHIIVNDHNFLSLKSRNLI